MKDFNKDKFNDSIRRKFSEAEVQPGNNVWEGIEAELLKQDNKIMKRKAMFYRNVAAAVIFIALISIYFNLQDFTFANTQNTTLTPVEIDSKNEQIFFSENDVLLSKPEAFDNSEDVGKEIYIREKSSEKSTFASLDNVNTNNDFSGQIVGITDNEKIVYGSSNNNLIASIAKVENITPSVFELPELKVEVKEVSYFAVSNLDKPKDKSGVSWNTNVNIGSGNFNPNSEITESPLFPAVNTLNNPGSSARTTGDDASYSNQERNAVEDLSSAPMQGNISFTFGLNFGVDLTEKWNIKSGLQYGAYRTSSSSSTVLRDRNSDELYPFHGASSSTAISDGRVVNVTSEYDLQSDFQILTIPLMASYKVIDRKFDVSLVAGLSADFIIKNTLKAGSDQINEIKFHQNDKQSYKNLFASSMAGIEISYPFADKYAVSIMPTYKRALSNITTDEATFNSMPAFIGLNMSLAYMF
ncbi:outer membrane beta-barrel protein [Marivirga tractuosa]|uniref:outer membrane beta-barrel protein n=1 Tax=Marivirga tractuosa TaxID=1006 RepID=UPI0035CFDC46